LPEIDERKSENSGNKQIPQNHNDYAKTKYHCQH